MPHYAISISPDEVSREYQVVLRGPGIDSEGRRYVFATTHRCAVFVEALNFAYEQGLRDGLSKDSRNEGRYFVVTGTTPDSLEARPEGWWARFKRRHLLRRA